MDRPSWIDNMLNRPWATSLQERVERPINNLSKTPCFFTTHFAKSNERRGEPVVVFDHKYFLELWLKVVHLIDEVNDMKKYITKAPVSKWEIGTNVMEEFAGKSLIPKEEDIATIIQWHKDVFPRADFEGQVKKWEEEYSEFLTARTNKDADEMLSELADLFIVACGIMRFNLIQGCQRMLLWNELRYTHGWAYSTCAETINKKMKKNRARKWEYLGNGNYHHVKGVED